MTQAPEQSTAKGWRPDDSSFGARLALVRQHMKWGNVAEAATACGIPTESWRTWERDGVVPRRIVEMAGLIADRSGCDYNWLLSGPRRTSGRDRMSPNGDSSHPARRTAKRNRTDEPRRPHLLFERAHGDRSSNGSSRRARPADNRPAGHPKAA